MLGLVLVVTAMVGLLLVKALYAMARGGEEFRVGGVEDIAWFVLALALVTNFFGVIPSSLYSTTVALSTVDGLIRTYNNLISALGFADEAISIATNVGLPIADAINYVATDSGFSVAIEVIIEVIEHLFTITINYLVHVLSMVVAALWFIRYALSIGEALRSLIPYIAFLLVLPRARDVAVIPAAIYLILGLALPAAINASHLPPLISMANNLPPIPNGLGLIEVEVADRLGKPVPAVLCIEGYGFPYNETVGLPNGAGIIVLPTHVFRGGGLMRYSVDCLVALFLRFNANELIMPNPYLGSTVVIRLPMIAIFNGDSLVGLFNYTWVGYGSVSVNAGPGYAVINVTTPCSGNLTVMAYAAQVRLMPLGLIEGNCSIKYSVTEDRPPNLVPKSWIRSIIINHELFCLNLEQLVNPSITYQGLEAPPQVVGAVLSIMRRACSGVGNYSEVISELRSIRLTASFTCREPCNYTRISVLIIGVEPYNLNYYALWGGTYTTWLNDSLMVIRNAESNPLNPGMYIALFVNAAYYSAIFLGFIGLVAMAPRIRYWPRLMSAIRVKPHITYEDVASIASPLVATIVSKWVRREDLVRRYYVVRRIYEISRHRYIRHGLRTAHWALRNLPQVAVAPHITLPALYGTSLTREYVMRRIMTMERGPLRTALSSIANTALSPVIVLRPYSVMNPLLRHGGVNALVRYMGGIKVNQASSVYAALRNYLSPGVAFYVAIRSVVGGVGDYLVDAVNEVWRSLDRPLEALALVGARFGVLRLIDAESTELIIKELVRELISRHGSLTGVKLVINNSVARPSDVLGVDDYTDVVVKTDRESVVVKAWVIKELLRLGGSLSA